MVDEMRRDEQHDDEQSRDAVRNSKPPILRGPHAQRALLRFARHKDGEGNHGPEGCPGCCGELRRMQQLATLLKPTNSDVVAKARWAAARPRRFVIPRAGTKAAPITKSA